VVIGCWHVSHKKAVSVAIATDGITLKAVTFLFVTNSSFICMPLKPIVCSSMLINFPGKKLALTQIVSNKGKDLL
jgi:hypothetical protein